VGEYPPTRANRPPGPAISPKWVNQLFVVRLYSMPFVWISFCQLLLALWLLNERYLITTYSETTNGCLCHCRLWMTARLYH